MRPEVCIKGSSLMVVMAFLLLTVKSIILFMSKIHVRLGLKQADSSNVLRRFHTPCRGSLEMFPSSTWGKQWPCSSFIFSYLWYIFVLHSSFSPSYL